MVDKPAGTHQIPGGPAVPNVVAHCEVTLSLAHPGASDHVKVAVWLPASGWNGRFQGTGGGGYAAGLFDRSLVPAIQQGYAAASTDAGVAFDPNSPATWALKSDGTVNTALLTNFASRSGHDMTVAAKQVVASFYGESASYSYWNGCSTGGRQGLMAAQRYPTDYDGIVAAAPAINWDRFIPSELWPQVVMNQEKNHPTSCEFNAFTQAAITACDSGEKVNGGIIDEPAKCGFDPRTLIGTKVVCDGETLTITAADAEVVRRIWQGPTLGGLPLWYGVPKGAPIDQLAGTTTAADGSSVGVPFPISDAWIRYFLKKQPSFDTATITYTQFAALFAQSQAEYNRIIGTDNPDLTAFRNANGKMITWHGSADPLIFSQGTENYYQRVRAATGGASRTDSFYRLFLAPGVGHCGLTSNGPIPTDALGAVVNWVEKGQAPATLPAAIVDSAGTPITRNLCPYPQVARYNGTGDPNSAANYQCAR
ncbi:tannase/feruloyl esterase family alpha/beta hydrolase [Streptomyces adonidis]|uniref:tannase/feruloyl esterase family alpha/beta hydrolase n=1 Tax=Streptomyces adonidis TaxID=3231367 RepID=UPI0034DB6E4C